MTENMLTAKMAESFLVHLFAPECRTKNLKLYSILIEKTISEKEWIYAFLRLS
jgi:hypothetical protein